MATVAELAATVSTLNDSVTLLTPAVQALVAQQGASTAFEAQIDPLNQALTGLNANVVSIVGMINTALGTPVV